MSGLSNIVDKILRDARIKANSTSEEASAKAQEIISIAQNDANIYYARHMEESYLEREAILNRRVAAGKLEFRKLLLQTKQDILSTCFKEALLAIKKDEKRYKSLIATMISFSEEGDVIALSIEDKGVITPEFIRNEYKKQGKKSNPKVLFEDFAGGIILKGAKTDKNMSLEVVLAGIRDDFETEIARALFDK